jgi:hypothetical protein
MLRSGAFCCTWSTSGGWRLATHALVVAAIHFLYRATLRRPDVVVQLPYPE